MKLTLKKAVQLIWGVMCKEKMDSREKALKRAGNLRLEITVIILACLVSFASFVASMKAGKDTWFSSSGALIVAVCAFSEFWSMSRHHKLNQIAAESTAYFGATPEKWRVPKKRADFNKVVLFILIVGTLIWGFGNKLF